MELSFTDIYKIVKKFGKENNLVITDNDFAEVANAYNKLKYEKININKNEYETEALITMITQDVISGSYDRRRTLLAHSDFRHMGYFDNWFKEGASTDINDVLSSYNISTDIFKGIPRLQNYHVVQVSNGHSIEIIQTADDDSPPNADLKIYIDNELVYDFSNNTKKIQGEEEEKAKKQKVVEEKAEPMYDYYKNTKKYNKWYVDLINSQRQAIKKNPVQNIYEVNGNTILETSYIRKLKSGKSIVVKQFRYSNGKFASKLDRLQVIGDIYG